MPKFAVILSGCGFKDGAEISEAVLTLLALDTQRIDFQIFAPNIIQDHVTDHLSDQPSNEKRNVLVESARIARGEITDLKSAHPEDFDGVILPGGFGAATNLCNFATKGPEGKVQEDVKSFLLGMHELKKPIGAICISPALMALLFGAKGVKVTIGNDEGTANAINKTGASHFNCPVGEIVVDEENKIVSTPAYMYGDAKLDEISSGISKLVQAVLKMI
jgi:enhancing lycopene biosynthesis protein 2